MSAQVISKKKIASQIVKFLRLKSKKLIRTIITGCCGRYGFYIFGIPSGIQTECPSEKTFKFSKPNQVPRNPPQTIDQKIFWKFQHFYPEIADDAVIVTPAIAVREGANLSLKGKLITTHLQQGDGIGPLQHDVFKLSSKRFFPKIVRVDEPVVSLVTPRQGAYYHWMFEILPRLQLVEDAGLKYSKVFISAHLPFQKKSLELLGIRDEHIIDASKVDAVISKEMIIPSVPCLMDHAPLWTCQFLTEKLITNAHQTGQEFKKIYISRSKATRRRILNEHEILNIIEKKGFKCVYLEELDFAEQIRLFYHADCIIAPHGAGLSNLVFAKPKTKLLELFSPSYVHPCFWYIANSVGIDYHYLLGDGHVYPDFYDPHQDPDFSIDIGKFLQILNILLMN